MKSRLIYDLPALKPLVAKPLGFWDGAPRVPTLWETLQLSLEAMGRLDIAYRNLICVSDLADAVNLDIRACIKTRNEWAEHIRRETDRSLHRYQRNPGDFQHSEAYFRVLVMITILQRDLGICYDLECTKTRLFRSSTDGFIHGLLTNNRKGNCANLPVLYAAMGRKLGYPIYLCCAKGHLFCRWTTKNGKERFNIEATGQGLSTPPDTYYRGFPRPITDQEIYHGYYLKNLDPYEETAEFMSHRGHCLFDAGRLFDAIVSFSHAHCLAPANPKHYAFLLAAMKQESEDRFSGKIPGSYRDCELLIEKQGDKVGDFVLDDRFPRTDKTSVSNLPPGPFAANA